MRRRRGDGGGDRFIFCRRRKVRWTELKALFLFLVRRFGTCYCAARRGEETRTLFTACGSCEYKSTGGVPSILYPHDALNVKREGGVKRTEYIANLLVYFHLNILFLCRTASKQVAN
jgi:hypothetical protein